MVAGGAVALRYELARTRTFSFGDNPALADQLLILVLVDKKRATCWAVSEGLKGTAIGKSMVALDGKRRPRDRRGNRSWCSGGSMMSMGNSPMMKVAEIE